MTKIPQLSVVVACVEADRTIGACLAALNRACGGLDAEIILVHDAEEGLPVETPTVSRGTKVIGQPGRPLIPHLWAAGYRASRGRAVAFTTGHCLVRPDWATSLLSALDQGATGAGGALALAPKAGLLGWAVYYLRYSAFLPPFARGEMREIPGDNAAYDRQALDANASSFRDGFWEVEFHRKVRDAGGRLVGVPEATADIGRSFSFGGVFRQRFAHGYRCGADRAAVLGHSPWRGMAALPVLPFLLLARILLRTNRWSDRLRVIASSPLLLLLAGSWSAGEAWGGWSARRNLPQTCLP